MCDWIAQHLRQCSLSPSSYYLELLHAVCLYGLGFFGDERCFDGCLVCFVTGKIVCFFVTSLDDMAVRFISVVVVSVAF